MSEQKTNSIKTVGDIAAAWWASDLRNPKFDSGDHDPTTGIIAAMTRDSSKGHPESSIRNFAEILAKRINERLERSSLVTIDVDYGPDEFLSECAGDAGLQEFPNSFSWKTTMWVSPGRVSVKRGYGGEIQVIWAKES